MKMYVDIFSFLVLYGTISTAPTEDKCEQELTYIRECKKQAANFAQLKECIGKVNCPISVNIMRAADMEFSILAVFSDELVPCLGNGVHRQIKRECFALSQGECQGLEHFICAAKYLLNQEACSVEHVKQFLNTASEQTELCKLKKERQAFFAKKPLE
eukprot:NP_001255822.2 Uncharacterized protein CELE_Y57G11C.1143 [Caenorhabditis elegans]